MELAATRAGAFFVDSVLEGTGVLAAQDMATEAGRGLGGAF
jgi:hypothetical protein